MAAIILAAILVISAKNRQSIEKESVKEME